MERLRLAWTLWRRYGGKFKVAYRVAKRILDLKKQDGIEVHIDPSGDTKGDYITTTNPAHLKEGGLPWQRG